MQSGYDIAAIECSLDWLFGEGFRFPPAIVRHRPDVIGVRDRPPFLAIGDAKITSDLGARRTSQQLSDYASVKVGKDQTPCWIVLGIPQSGAARLQRLIARLGIARHMILVVEVPDVLLSGREL